MRFIVLAILPILAAFLAFAVAELRRSDPLTLVLAEGKETLCGLDRHEAALGHDTTLVLKNRSGESYVLSAPLFFASAEPRLAEGGNMTAAAGEDAIEIAPNDTAIIALTPRAEGVFALECFPAARPHEIARAGLAVGEGS